MIYLNYPEYKTIKKQDLNPMAIILVAGSNPLTKWFENSINKYPYKPPFTHALIHIENGACCDVGLTTTIKDINDIIKKSNYYLSIELVDLLPAQIEKGQALCYKKAGSPQSKFKPYDFFGFFAFGLRKLGIKVKSSENFDFCSDMVIDTFSSMGHPLFKTMIGELTSPCNLHLKLKLYESARIRIIDNESQ
jgi:hypothetical protein